MWLGAACTPATHNAPAVQTPAPSPTAPTPATLPTQTASPSATRAPSETPTPADTPTVTITPTYAILRGEVLERSNCRYGPGAPYLYKYGLVAGSNLEVIGRNERGTWILVQAIGGDNPCWVKASLMDVQGDVLAVATAETRLPFSPSYLPPSGVSAARQGDEVTIFWNEVALRPGDDSGQYRYLVEAWVCQQGELVFTPLGTYETAIRVVDEPGCEEPSHGRLYAVEKHGYSPWRKIAWPAPEMRGE